MGNRTASTTIQTIVQQDGTTLQNTNLQASTTTPAQAVPLITVAALGTGNNTIAIPAGASGVTIQPPQGTANTLILKGVAGDTGVVIQSAGQSQANPTSLSFAPAAMTSFVLNSAIAISVTLIWQ